MSFIICLGIFISIACFLSCLFHKQIEETLALAVFSIIMILYIAGIFQNLLIGKYIIIIFSGISVFFISYQLITTRGQNIKKYIITPGLLAFLIFIVINILLCSNRWMSEWDEFSHWGRVVLNMYQFNRLGNCAGSTVMFQGYPSAVSLWQYFFVSFKLKFSEPYLYASDNVLSFCLMLPVFKRITWKNRKKFIVLLFVILTMPLIFYENFWSSLYVDGILGIWMLYIFYIYFSERENIVFKQTCICLALATFPLVKASGSGLGALAILIIAIDIFACSRIIMSWKKKRGLVLSYVLSLILGKQSWTWYLKATETSMPWNTSNLTFEKVVSLFLRQGEDYQYTTIKNFWKAFISERNCGGRISLFQWILLISVLLIFMYGLKIYQKKELFWYGGGFITCIVIYAVSLLLLYCFTYSFHESVALASYERYINSILLGIAGFIIFMLINNITKMTDKLILLILFCVMLPIGAIRTYTISLKQTKEDILIMRLQYENIREFSEEMEWQKDKVYLIDQGGSGFVHVVGGCIATPICFSPNYGWSLGEPLYDGDIWTLNYSLEEWENILKSDNYTYVYIYKQNEQFIEAYGKVFENKDEIKDRALYKIDRDKNDTLFLRLYKEY